MGGKDVKGKGGSGRGGRESGGMARLWIFVEEPRVPSYATGSRAPPVASRRLS